MIGKSVGPYEIIEPLGTGGMGEVYLGEDTRLGRKVAIKVLPAEFAGDPERLARFEQEARAAAALNHPHIAVVHDVGSEPGEDGETTHFMVQEYLEGNTLREPLEKGPLPLKKAVDLATEIAEALAAAHSAGIVHRDLKPENVFVTKEGHAKVLDFGLAKLMEMAASPGGSATMSPTMLGTVAGQVMGTAGYMAPEQINGEEIDHRADLFAFGCVLYGMVAGRQAFAGRNVMQTLDLILAEDAQPIVEIDAHLPLKLQWILDKALAKERGRRYQHADDAIVDLRTLASEIEAGTSLPVGGAAPAASAAAGSGRAIPLKLAIPIAGAMTIVAALAVWSFLGPVQPPVDPPLRFAINLPAGQRLGAQGNQISLSPDGRQLVYRESSRAQLHHRPMDRIGDALLAGTEGAVNPFFSPDSQWVAFSASGALKKVNLAGGAPFVLCSNCTDGRSAGFWGEGDNVVFSAGGSLWRTAGSGGNVSLLAAPGERQAEGSFERPYLLPGGQTALATLRSPRYPGGAIVAVSLVSDRFSIVIEGGSDPRYSPTGHLIYLRGDSLFAVPFDARLGVVTEQPTPILPEVTAAVSEAFGRFSLAENGTLAYYSSTGDLADRHLVWVDRAGNATPITDRARFYRQPRLSPDGRSLVVLIGEAAQADSIWIHDMALDTLSPFSSTGDQHAPVWSPDGTWIAFASDEGGDPTQDNIYRRPADRSQEATLMFDKEGQQYPSSISPDGRTLFFSDGTPGSFDIWTVPIGDNGEPEPFLQGPEDQVDGVLSPDGNWIAYESDDSGQLEVSVEPYPGPGSKITISPDGGFNPVWSPDGREIFYRFGDQMRVVEVLETDPAFRPGPSRELFEARYRAEAQRNYDVDIDGQRFVMIDTLGTGTTIDQITIVLNWFEELKQRVPTK